MHILKHSENTFSLLYSISHALHQILTRHVSALRTILKYSRLHLFLYNVRNENTTICTTLQSIYLPVYSIFYWCILMIFWCFDSYMLYFVWFTFGVLCCVRELWTSAMIRSDFSTNFSLENQQKDLRLVVSLADQVDQPLHVAAAVNEVRAAVYWTVVYYLQYTVLLTTTFFISYRSREVYTPRETRGETCQTSHSLFKITHVLR